MGTPPILTSTCHYIINISSSNFALYCKISFSIPPDGDILLNKFHRIIFIVLGFVAVQSTKIYLLKKWNNVHIESSIIISDDFMRSKALIVLLTLIAFVAMSALALGAEMQTTQMSSNQTCITKSQEDLTLKMRELWAEHVIWTRMFIMSVADNTSDKALVTERLLQNYNDMADAMKPYYGNENGDKFGELIEEHLLTAATLVEAAKAGNSTAATAAEKKWYENADEIAAFENSINPNWDKTAQMTMWHDHLKVTKDEAVARLTMNYTADIEAFDQIEAQANMMADSWSDGIMKQFPEKFKE